MKATCTFLVAAVSLLCLSGCTEITDHMVRTQESLVRPGRRTGAGAMNTPNVEIPERREVGEPTATEHRTPQEHEERQGSGQAPRSAVAGRVVKKRIAVVGFREEPKDTMPLKGATFVVFGAGPGVGSTDIAPYKGFVADVTAALVATEKFLVVERQNLGKELAEILFSESRFAFRSVDQIHGKVMGVQYLVTGSIRGADAKEKGLRLVLRAFDTSTSEVVAAATAEGTSKSKLVSEAVEKLAAALGAEPWRGRVADVTGRDVYINAGRTLGIRKGDRFKVYNVGKGILDPNTGQVLGYGKVPAGLIEVHTVEEQLAIAKEVPLPLVSSDERRDKDSHEGLLRVTMERKQKPKKGAFLELVKTAVFVRESFE